MSTLSNSDFSEFKSTFFDNTLEKNQEEIFHQKQEAYTYFLIATLDKAVRNRTIEFKDRMEAISLFKYIVMNTNYSNKSVLQYHVTENERLIIRQFLLQYTQMPNDTDVDDDHSEALRSYAKRVLHSMFPDSDEGN
jgi:transcriptional regulator of met regulon